jgi:hypothetical protein
MPPIATRGTASAAASLSNCGDRRAGQIGAVVAGGAEQGLATQSLPRGRDFAVVLAQVGAVGADRRGQAPVVVDDQRHPVAAAQRQQGARLALTGRGIGGLVAVLQPDRAGTEYGVDPRQQARVVVLVGSDRVDAAARPG